MLAPPLSRQDARLRKYRLLQRGEFGNAELMLHYFHSRGDLFDAIIIPLHCFADLQQARATEYSFIHSWKPQLNAPWVVKLNPTSTTRFAQPFTVRSTYGSPGKRLWMKVRRRLHTLGLLHLCQNTILEPVDNWLLLINLANGGMKVFCQRFAWETYKATFGYANVYDPCNHLRLKYFVEVRHLGRFYAATRGASICVLPACLLLTSFLNNRRTSKQLAPSSRTSISCVPRFFVLPPWPWISFFAVFAHVLLALILCQASYRS